MVGHIRMLGVISGTYTEKAYEACQERIPCGWATEQPYVGGFKAFLSTYRFHSQTHVIIGPVPRLSGLRLN